MAISGVAPYLIVRDGDAAIAWYVEVFDAVVVTRWPEADRRIGHSELRIGRSPLYLADEHPELEGIVGPATLGGPGVILDVEVDDVRAVHDRAVAGGATSIRAPGPDGGLVEAAKVRDPFGHVWLITRVTSERGPG
jgi:PhnB protein